MLRIVKEPLLHFILLGAMLYLASSYWMEQNVASERTVVVSNGQIRHLQTLFSKTWQRSPSNDELANVIQEYVLEQIAYREGLALGLEREDTVITRRIRQKLDFIAEESGVRVEVSDALLRNYSAKHTNKFRLEPRLTLRQIYLDPQRHGDELSATAQNLLARLTVEPELDSDYLGDQGLFKLRYQAQTPTELARIFGREFAEQATELKTDEWQGPVKSSFGIHLVRVEQKVAGRMPEFSSIRDKVLQEWENKRRDKAVQTYYANLLDRYQVIVEWPETKERD